MRDNELTAPAAAPFMITPTSRCMRMYCIYNWHHSCIWSLTAICISQNNTYHCYNHAQRQAQGASGSAAQMVPAPVINLIALLWCMGITNSSNDKHAACAQLVLILG
jgi:hypothetical protein